MKLAVIYDSKTNNTAAVAGYMAEAMNSLEGVEAKTFLYSEVDTEFVKECKGVVFGCPTYAAGPTSDFYTWMEKNAGGLNLAGKLGGVFATEQYIHGGADLTMNALLIHLLVYGMMIYSGGASCGKPVIHMGPVEVSPKKEDFKELFEIFGNTGVKDQRINLLSKRKLRKMKTAGNNRKTTSNRVALYGLLIALAFVLSYVETLFPVYLGAPGVKLGLANLVTVIALYGLGVKEAFAINVVRVLLSGFTVGNMSSILFGMAGAVLSLFLMAVCKKLRLFDMTGISIIGGVAHNIGQFLVAAFVTKTFGVFSYLPVLLIAGTVAGALIGLLGGIILKRISRILPKG